MKGGSKAPAAKRPRRFFTIRHKLMLFVVALCALVLGLVWVLNVQLLEPFYHRQLYKELDRTATAYVNLIRKYGTIQDPGNAGGLKQGFWDAITGDDYLELMLGKCVEVADSSGYYILGGPLPHDPQCLLHPTPGGNSWLAAASEPLWNSPRAKALRYQTLASGDQTITLSDGGYEQLAVCKNVDGLYTVIVSTDLERVSQASQIIGQQMRFVAVVLLAVSILGAWLFSRWFTRPITQLSHAAREMAKGNFNVRVQPTTGDEIGVLAQDFNTMAGEVSRTYDLQRDLIANVSHDLRTPLTLIKGYAETVRDLTGEDKAKRDDQLDVIIDESDRLSALVNSVMQLSKYSSGTMPMNPVTFDLAQLCEEVAERYENICAQEGYHLEIAADIPCPVHADPDGLQRVIHNLLANALHHVGPDGYLAVRVLPKDGGARVEVEDHGAGIAKEDLPYIFDKYYRSRADAGKVGTGLGLSITKAILASQGFAFGVQSEVGKGSLFWFETGAPAAEEEAHGKNSF